MEPITCPPLLTLNEMSRRLGVAAKWLRTEAQARRIPHLKAGSQFLFSVEAVERVLLERAEQQQQTASAEEPEATS